MQELEKILEEIELEKKRLVFYPDCSSAFSAAQIRTIEKIEQIICKYMSNCKRMNDGWIPIQDKLPEDDVDVLITYADIDDERETGIDITTYGDATLGGNKLDYKEWRNPFPYFKGNYKVIAWRPLPDPYRPERSNDEKE